MAGAIQLLKDDHKTVEDLFKRYEEAGEGAVAEKTQIRDRIVKELSIHAYIEEEVFYPATREIRQETEQMLKEAYEEHAQVKDIVTRLATLEPEAPDFDQLMTQLIGDVRHHVEEEENEMFPVVNEAMSSQDLSELGERLQEAKREAPGGPPPASEG